MKMDNILYVFITLGMMLYIQGAAFASGSAAVIKDINVTPSSGIPSSSYIITLKVENLYRPKGRLTLYQVRESLEGITVNINDMGADGDALEGDSIYTGRGIVPESAAPGAHRFQVFILDNKGRKSNILEYTFTVLELL